ncbi:NmrA family NAD(P)-binding protein [Nonomuraea sp. NPDC001831]|uniref:NAD-dependent epimerase/dehydratase family protein n=1 Tax=Nonomuraea sp. NPDC001831 TaxID=3364340 RepID=UPI0036A62D5B
MYLVTGATGTVGSELLALLAGRDVPVRALTRDPAKAAFPAGVGGGPPPPPPPGPRPPPPPPPRPGGGRRSGRSPPPPRRTPGRRGGGPGP